MTFRNFFLLDLIIIFVVKLDMIECVSVIHLQLIPLPFSPFVILVSHYVYVSIPKVLPLSIASPLFVYLC